MTGFLAAALALGAGAFAARAATLVRLARVDERIGVVRADSAERSPALARLGNRALAAGAVLLATALGVLVAGPAGGVAGALAAAVAPGVRRRRAAARRAHQIEAQLADAVVAVAGALRSGASLVQAVALAEKDVGSPLGDALRAVGDRARLGVPLERALQEWVESDDAAEVRLVAGVLGLHRTTAGETPMVLEHVARALRARHATAREVRSLTAQARLSGAILGLLPIGFFLFLSATSRAEIDAAFRSPIGASAIALGLGMQAVAFLWIRRLLRVEA